MTRNEWRAEQVNRKAWTYRCEPYHRTVGKMKIRRKKPMKRGAYSVDFSLTYRTQTKRNSIIRYNKTSLGMALTRYRSGHSATSGDAERLALSGTLDELKSKMLYLRKEIPQPPKLALSDSGKRELKRLRGELA